MKKRKGLIFVISEIAIIMLLVVAVVFTSLYFGKSPKLSYTYKGMQSEESYSDMNAAAEAYLENELPVSAELSKVTKGELLSKDGWAELDLKNSATVKEIVQVEIEYKTEASQDPLKTNSVYMITDTSDKVYYYAMPVKDGEAVTSSHYNEVINALTSLKSFTVEVGSLNEDKQYSKNSYTYTREQLTGRMIVTASCVYVSETRQTTDVNSGRTDLDYFEHYYFIKDGNLRYVQSYNLQELHGVKKVGTYDYTDELLEEYEGLTNEQILEAIKRESLWMFSFDSSLFIKDSNGLTSDTQKLKDFLQIENGTQWPQITQEFNQDPVITHTLKNGILDKSYFNFGYKLYNKENAESTKVLSSEFTNSSTFKVKEKNSVKMEIPDKIIKAQPESVQA